jgi:hypothetical protein
MLWADTAVAPSSVDAAKARISVFDISTLRDTKL